jgi:membrane carboxypeptidase/penicillin-binding protein
VVDALRSPGSAFKPFVFATALEEGITAAERISCEETVFVLPTGEEWTPWDFGAKFHDRELAMREAIVLSCNVVASKTIARLTPERVASTAKRLGLQTTLNPVLSLALGTSETTVLNMASAFMPFVNGGRSIHWPTNNPILRIEDQRGRILWQNTPTLISGALDPRIGFIVTDMLQDVLRPPGTGSLAGSIFPRPAAGKTGTSENNRDAWFVGYSPSLVAAVYVGHDDNVPLSSTGGALAGPIWAHFMAGAHRDIPVQDFQRPAGVDEVTVCVTSGLLAREECPVEYRLTELFLSETTPADPCTIHEPSTPSPLPWWNWLFPRSEEDDSPEPEEEGAEEIDDSDEEEAADPEEAEEVIEPD